MNARSDPDVIHELSVGTLYTYLYATRTHLPKYLPRKSFIVWREIC